MATMGAVSGLALLLGALLGLGAILGAILIALVGTLLLLRAARRLEALDGSSGRRRNEARGFDRNCLLDLNRLDLLLERLGGIVSERESGQGGQL